MFLVYKNHEIISSGDNFRIKLPTGAYVPEVASSVSTAKKWIDAKLNECRTLSGLDRIAKEQAAYYGMTPDKHASFMSDMAEAQELIERNPDSKEG